MGVPLGAIFDWDGVVIDSHDQHERAWAALAAELVAKLPEREVVHAQRVVRLRPLVGALLLAQRAQPPRGDDAVGDAARVARAGEGVGLGMHARAAAKFVNTASEYSSHVEVERNGQRVNGKSIMGVMMLAASKGTRLTLKIDGEDEQQAMQALEKLIADRFGENE